MDGDNSSVNASAARRSSSGAKAGSVFAQSGKSSSSSSGEGLMPLAKLKAAAVRPLPAVAESNGAGTTVGGTESSATATPQLTSTSDRVDNSIANADMGDSADVGLELTSATSSAAGIGEGVAFVDTAACAVDGSVGASPASIHVKIKSPVATDAIQLPATDTPVESPPVDLRPSSNERDGLGEGDDLHDNSAASGGVNGASGGAGSSIGPFEYECLTTILLTANDIHDKELERCVAELVFIRFFFNGSLRDLSKLSHSTHCWLCFMRPIVFAD